MRPFLSVNRNTSRLIRTKRGAALLLALAAGAFVYGCQKSAADNAPGAVPPAMPVQVQIAPAVKIPDTTEYLSILKSRHSAAIHPQVEGQITRIFVKSGDHAEAGTPLLQIDPLKQEATVNSQEASRTAQEANLRYAKVSLERAEKLFDAKVISKQELDNAQSGYEAALSQVETETQTVLAKATIQNPQGKLRISQQVRAQITWGVHEGPVIPVLAVLRINGQFFAFVAINEGKGTVARQTPLKLGDTIGNDFVVLDGLKAGDHLIISGTQFLQDGMPVTEQIQSKGQNNSVRYSPRPHDRRP